MSAEERKERVQEISSNYDTFLLVDKSDILTKGDLFIQINNYEGYMHWEVWIRLDSTDFFEKLENLNDEKNILRGEILSQLPQYKNSKGEKVELEYTFNGHNDLPIVKPLSLDTALGKGYRNGISIEQVKNWMKAMHH